MSTNLFVRNLFHKKTPQALPFHLEPNVDRKAFFPKNHSLPITDVSHADMDAILEQ